MNCVEVAVLSTAAMSTVVGVRDTKNRAAGRLDLSADA